MDSVCFSQSAIRSLRSEVRAPEWLLDYKTGGSLSSDSSVPVGPEEELHVGCHESDSDVSDSDDECYSEDEDSSLRDFLRRFFDLVSRPIAESKLQIGSRVGVRNLGKPRLTEWEDVLRHLFLSLAEKVWGHPSDEPMSDEEFLARIHALFRDPKLQSESDINKLNQAVVDLLVRNFHTASNQKQKELILVCLLPAFNNNWDVCRSRSFLLAAFVCGNSCFSLIFAGRSADDSAALVGHVPQGHQMVSNGS